VISVTITHHRCAEIEEHRVSRGAFAAGIRRRAADPNGGDAALTQLDFQVGRTLDERAVTRFFDL
jgi:hypothetical protein